MAGMAVATARQTLPGCHVRVRVSCQGAGTPWLARRYFPSVLSTLKRSSTVMLRFWLNGDTSALRVYGAYMGTTMSKSGRTQWKPMGPFHSKPQPSALSSRHQVGVGMDLPRSRAARVAFYWRWW